MKVQDIINEERTGYEKLDSFRKFKSGAGYTPGGDFGDERITVGKSPSTRTQSTATVNSPPAVSARNSKAKELERVARIQSIFNAFGSDAAQHGKEPFYSSYKDGSAGVGTITDNGVKVQIGRKPSKTTMEIYIENVNDKNKESLVELLSSMGYQLDQTVKRFRIIPSKPDDVVATFKEFWNIVDSIEELGPDFKKGGGAGRGAGSLITNTQAPLQYYLWLAKNIYESVKNNTRWGFSRGGGDSAYDRYDSLIIVGITKGGAEQQASGREAYREHVVPCDLINRMGIEICKSSPKASKYRNQVIIQVAKMIHRNLAIVLSSDQDRQVMDIENKLMTSMPPGWKDGDSILARFTYCGIPVYQYKSDHPENGKRISEEDL